MAKKTGMDHQAERSDAAGAAILRSMLDAAPIGMYYVDKHDRYVTVNQCFAAFLGRTADVVEGWPVGSVLPPDEYERHAPRLERCLRGEMVAYQEERHDPASGGIRFFHGLYSPARDEAGQVVGCIVFAGDITEPKQAAATQEDTISLLRDFAQAVSDISGILDEEGITVELFRVSTIPTYQPWEASVGRTLEEALPAQVAATIRAALAQALASGEMRRAEYEMDFAGEGRRQMEIRLTPMQQLIGGRRVVAFNVTDVTDRVRHERILRLSSERRRKSALFNDLISNKIAPHAAVFQGQEMGLNLLQSFSLYVLIAPDPAVGDGAAYPDVITRTDLLRDVVEDILQDARESVVWCSEDGVVVLHPAPAVRGKDFKAEEMMFAQALADGLGSRLPALTISLGIAGSLTTVANLGRSYRHALTAANTSKHTQAAGNIRHYLDIGVYQIIANLPAEAEADEFVARTIGRLVAYDAEHKTELVATLEEIIAGDSLNAVAKKLFIHPKTVLFRKRRIEEILETTLDAADTRLTMALALKLWLMRGNS